MPVLPIIIALLPLIAGYFLMRQGIRLDRRRRQQAATNKSGTGEPP